jgi:hypothetical protein
MVIAPDSAIGRITNSTPSRVGLKDPGQHRCELDAEREKLIARIETFSKGGPQACTKSPHGFFGKLTADEWGKGMYKHLDHHLQQFNG